MLNRASASSGVLIVALFVGAAVRPEHADGQRPTRANVERPFSTAAAEDDAGQPERPAAQLPADAPEVAGLVDALGSLYVDALLRYELDRARNVPPEWPGLRSLILGSLVESAVITPMSVYFGDERVEGLWRAFGSSMLESLAIELGEQALGRSAPF